MEIFFVSNLKVLNDSKRQMKQTISGKLNLQAKSTMLMEQFLSIGDVEVFSSFHHAYF